MSTGTGKPRTVRELREAWAAFLASQAEAVATLARPITSGLAGSTSGTSSRPVGSRTPAAAVPGMAVQGPTRPTAEDARQAALAATGRRLWERLHRWAAGWDGDHAAALAFLADFRKRLPSAGCQCRTGWDEAIRADPPDLGSRRDLMNWTIRVHNAINRKLGKPEVGEDEARRIWGAD